MSTINTENNITYSYAKCIKSFGGFKEGDIFRIGKVHWSPLNDCYYILLDEDNPEYVLANDNLSDIHSENMDKFIFICNSNIASIDDIKKIFDLLQD